MPECRGCVLKLSKYVPGRTEEEVKEEYNLEKVIKLASNENPHGPSPLAVETIKELSSKAYLYPDGSYTKLKTKLSEKLSLSPEYIALGCGSDDVIKLLGESFLEVDDEVITADITFPVYKHVATLMEANTVTVPLKSFKHDLDSMADAINEKTKMIFVCNPNNPTGTMVTYEEIEKFLNKVPERVIVVFDEAYKEYVESKEFPDSLSFLKDRNNVVILRTFSKIHALAGLRVGYGIASPEIIDVIEKVRQPFNVNAFAHQAAASSLEDEKHIEYSHNQNIKEKDYLVKTLNSLGFETVDSEANFLMVKSIYDDMELFEDLMKKGVIIRPGKLLGIPGYFRLTIGTEEDNRYLIQRLKEILKEKGDHRALINE